MILTWTKQFLLASAIFGVVLAGQTLSLIAKEKQMAEKNLKEASRTVRVSNGNHNHLN